MKPQLADNIRFGDFVLDTKGRRLLRDGNRIPLGPLEFKLLETLVVNRDRVLTGDELRILVWSEVPSRQVVPAGDVNALYVSMRRLRAALGDAGKWIVNISKVGYTISPDVPIEEFTAATRDLPEDTTPFVGRENDLVLVRESIQRSRLVTLTGPPGVGKTRLAKEAVRSLDGAGSEIHFIDLASVVGGQYVGRALLSHFELPDSLETDLNDGLSKFFAHRSAAIVFDNCEHVIERASDVIETLLKSSRNVHVIATSREPMLLHNEIVVIVAPLSTPPSDDSQTLEKLTTFEAPRLFIELARQRRRDLKFGDRDLMFIAELCRQLEGIPVAIELAAAQVDAYSIEQIATLVEDRFRVFQRRGSDSSRHNTLDTAVEWSYNLLSEKEQGLLRRLSVLKGGWTAEIASNVCAADEISSLDTIHLLAGLVRRSLVQMYSRKGANRYSMLEMIRQYGRLRLSEAGEEASMLKKRTAVFLDLVERAFDDGNRGEWPAILGAEYDNIRAVLARTIIKEDDIVSGLRMCGSLSRFWFNHGHISEAQSWTKAALDKDDRSNPAARAKVLMAAGFFFGQTPGLVKDTERRRSYFEESIGIWEEVGDKNNLGITLVGYAFFLHRHGEYQKGIEVAERSVEILSGTENPVLLARAANNLALTLLETGEFQRALPILEKALRNARVSNDVFLEAVCLHNLAEVALFLKDFDRSADVAEQCLELFVSLGLRPNVARTKLLQSEIAAANGEITRALDLQEQALAEFGEIGDNQGITDTFEAIATTLSKQGTHHELAIVVMSAAASLRADLGIGRGPAKDKLFRSQMKRSQAALGKTAAAAASSKGRILSVSEVTELMRGRGVANLQT